ncbi:hypothetical protein MUP32_03965 [Candidatus Microgenomates bacterium]|nr:hypothetical protein [Candidatus Microgenomates bacterium]
MHRPSARKDIFIRLFSIRKIVSLFLILVFLTINIGTSCVYAQTSTPIPAASITPTGGVPVIDTRPNWQYDPVITELGKSADRARQLLWWVFSHQPVHYVPILAELWGFSRNIVYIFVVVVIVAFGLGLILSRRQSSFGPIFSGIASPLNGLNLPSVFMRIAAVLFYVTFSYVFILGMIQISDILMKFFIENIGGKDLFNVIFAGTGNSEENYLSFIGFRDMNSLNNEMANMSILIIRLTSLSYYVMSIIIILRTIILWFLLIVAPFLGLLMPFVFIRNIGWIWIGVFFQWLFYGPLMTLLLASLTRIWVAGIPYPFDFSRVNKPEGFVYKTAINILYGGPAQTLAYGNSANYIDTFAEYVISLIMLWAAIIFPWFLLRIFRDYCCSMIASGNATMKSIFDRLRQAPPSPPPTAPGPATTAGMAVELPFRQRVEEKIREVTRIEDIRNISNTSTDEIARKMDVSVSSLKDVSRLEMDQVKRVEIENRLEKISAPEVVTSAAEREQYETIKKELEVRALAGDSTASAMLMAGEGNIEAVAAEIEKISGRSSIASVTTPGVYAPTISAQTAYSQTVIEDIANKVGISESQVRTVLNELSRTNVTSEQNLFRISQKTGVSLGKVKDIMVLPQSLSKSVVATRQTATPKVQAVPVTMAGKTVQTQVSLEDYEEVRKMWLNHYRQSPVPVSETIKNRQQWLSEETKKMTNISHHLTSIDPKLKQKGIEEVSEILPFMILGGFSDAEIVTYVKAKLEACKQVEEEAVSLEKTKEDTKKEIKEEEETLLEIPVKAEEAKQTAAVQSRSLEKEIKLDKSGGSG